MTEDELQAKVAGLCARLGVNRYRSPRSMLNPGFPDLILWRDRLIFRELKTEKGRLSYRQSDVGGSLALAGQDWEVWRPEDLESGRIERELRAL